MWTAVQESPGPLTEAGFTRAPPQSRVGKRSAWTWACRLQDDIVVCSTLSLPCPLRRPGLPISRCHCVCHMAAVSAASRGPPLGPAQPGHPAQWGQGAGSLSALPARARVLGHRCWDQALSPLTRPDTPAATRPAPATLRGHQAKGPGAASGGCRTQAAGRQAGRGAPGGRNQRSSNWIWDCDRVAAVPFSTRRLLLRREGAGQGWWVHAVGLGALRWVVRRREPRGARATREETGR